MHCATSLDEFTIGQHVLVVAGLGCYRRGLVGDITRTKVVVLYDDSERVGFHRPDEIIVGELLTPGADDHEIVCEVESTIAHLIGTILRGDQ